MTVPHSAARLLLPITLMLAVAALLLSGCGTAARVVPTPTPWPTPIISEKPTYVVQRGNVIDLFSITGQVVPVTWEPVYFTVDGRLSALKVTEGITVAKGDILAELDMKTFADQLAQAQISLEQAQDQFDQDKASKTYALERAKYALQLQELTLQKLKRQQAQSAPVQLDQAQKELERARLALQKAQSEYDKIAWRSDAGQLPQAVALEQATLDFEMAENRYRLATLSDLDIQIASQEVQVKLAQLAVRELEENIDPAVERNLAKAKLQVQAIERQMDERRLRAPYAGKVVAIGLNVRGFDRGVATRPKVGDNVPAFTPLVIIARPEPLEIVVAATSGRVSELVVGQAVSVTHSSARDTPFIARVAALPIQNLSTGVQPAPTPVVRIALPAAPPPMAIGDFVTIDVTSRVRDNTLFLPPAAGRRFSGHAFVVMTQDGKQRRIDITTGLENDRQIEITSGLHEGDVVIGP